MKKLISTLLFWTLFLSSFAQSQKILGKVINSKNEILQGASVEVIGQKKLVVTDVEGRFSIEVPAGKEYEIMITAAGYQTKILSEVKPGASNELLIVLEITGGNLSEVVVKGSARKETTAALIQFQKNTTTVAQVVSAESIRKSPDRNTGDVLKRVSGLSIQDGKYIIVRGLADRYNAAMLNGALLSSTEPDRKTFSFDIFPSTMIENIVVNKAALPEMSGEFAGGMIQINTKDIPTKNFFQVSLGSGLNTETIGRDFLTYQGNNLDVFGIPGSIRKLPAQFPGTRELVQSTNAEKAAFGQQLPDIWGYQSGSLPIFANASISGGNKFNVGANSTKSAGVIYSLFYNRQSRFIDNDRNLYFTDRVPRFLYNDAQYSSNTLMGALVNASIVSGKNKWSWKNAYSINSNDQVILRNGLDVDAIDIQRTIRARELSFVSNRLLTSQLINERSFGAYKFNAVLNYSFMKQEMPDLRRLKYTMDDNGDFFANISNFSGNPRNAGRFYSDLDEHVAGITTDIQRTIKWNGKSQTIKAGGMLQAKTRSFRARGIGIVLSNTADQNLRYLPETEIFALKNFGENQFYLDDLTSPSDSYDAESQLVAGFLQFDNSITDKLRLVWGARYEYFNQFLDLPGFKSLSNGDLLPSFNMTYKLNNQTNIRLSGSQTLSRPEFRELSPFDFYDYERNAQIFGNTQLQRGKINNADLRYEIYPNNGELITFGVFYKYFNTPIEAVYETGQGTAQITFQNAKSAYSYGAEIDIRKSLNFIGGKVFEKLAIFGNASIIKSEVQFQPNASGVRNRPLQGQSPYLINGGLQFDNSEKGTFASLLFNVIGRRIYQVGNADFPDIWENPRPLLDFQITQALSSKMDLKFSVTDILNRPAIFYWDTDNNKKYGSGEGEDLLTNRARFGTNISFQFIYKL